MIPRGDRSIVDSPNCFGIDIRSDNSIEEVGEEVAGDMSRTIKQSVANKYHLRWGNYVRYYRGRYYAFILLH